MQSALDQIRQIELLLTGVLSGFDVHSLSKPEQKLVTNLKRNIIEARLDVRDFEYAETGAEQRTHGHAAAKRLDRVRKDIVAASEYNMFTSIDVAELGARIEQLIGELTEEK